MVIRKTNPILVELYKLRENTIISLREPTHFGKYKDTFIGLTRKVDFEGIYSCIRP